MKQDENAHTIVRAIIGLGRSLDLPVTAEGIETDSQYRMVVDEGCTQAQGYLFGKPERSVKPVSFKSKRFHNANA
jgi:EAL domain-containing protein (putative c-di-GMP-specific phosphodiesterase class I)